MFLLQYASCLLHRVGDGVGVGLVAEVVVDVVDLVFVDGLADVVVDVEFRAGADDRLDFVEELVEVHILRAGDVLERELASERM